MAFLFLFFRRIVTFSFFLITSISFADPIPYRSISFHHGVVDTELLPTAARIGFNNIELQTEGNMLQSLKKLRNNCDSIHLKDLAFNHKFSLSLWVHEFENVDSSWGSLTLENQLLWAKIAERYRYILQDQFPEIKYLVLTVVESEVKITNAAICSRLIQTILKEVNKSGKVLILRTFIWNPKELSLIQDVIKQLPNEVIIENKYVPQDWHLRSINNPLIAMHRDKRQIVEIDIAGEYFGLSHVANCFTQDIEQRFEYWKKQNIWGICVRVNRLKVKQSWSVKSELNEANLWIIGYLSQGLTAKEAWLNYAKINFKGVNPIVIQQILEPTGQVIAEALCVERETFGDTRHDVSIYQTLLMSGFGTKGRYALDSGFGKIPDKELWNKPYKDEDDCLYRNPFYRNWSVWKWDSTYKQAYHEIRKGTPQVIEAKTKAYDKALALADRSLNLLDSIQSNLPKRTYPFLKWKLEENRFFLRAYCEEELAWLNATGALYATDSSVMTNNIARMNRHLDHLKELNNQKNETFDGIWHGKSRNLERGSYINLTAFDKLFRKYFERLFEVRNQY